MVAGKSIEARRACKSFRFCGRRGSGDQAADGARDEAVSDEQACTGFSDAAWGLSGIDLRAEDEDFDGIGALRPE